MINVKWIGGLVLALASVACGSNDDANKDNAGGSAGASGSPGAGGAAGGSAGGAAGAGGGTYSLQGCEGLSTGYAGDETCLTPPADGEGVQFHFGPDDYDAAGDFVISPGEEYVRCKYFKSANDKDVYFNGYHARLRPGSHHLRLFVLNQDIPDGSGECGIGNVSEQLSARFLFGATSPSIDVGRPDQELSPDVKGMAVKLPAHAQIVMEVHFYNTGKDDLLQEAWANFHFTDTYEILGDAISLIGGFGMQIQPGSTEVVQASTTVPEDMRILVSVGHYHAHTTRFSAWWTPQGGKKTLINESFDWTEPATLDHVVGSENGSPDAEIKKAGGWDGPLQVKKGDRIDWECEIVNDCTSANGVCPAGTVLKFENQVYTAEMCNLFGFYAPSFGDTWNVGCTSSGLCI